VIASAHLLTAILGAWLWTSFVAPAISRGFGVPMASGWRLSRRNQHLSKVHYVWGCGVFAVGSGLFLFVTLRQYLYCILIVGKLPHLSGPHLALRLTICLAAGLIFGIFTAPLREMSDFLLQYSTSTAIPPITTSYVRCHSSWQLSNRAFTLPIDSRRVPP
jgi:hypothetical protein